ncbi:MAG: hypothetical protein JWO42_3096, partial [Chloroflexi bacterium]|nr:hypothetical protein [Chloroflexota bacterium]
MRHDVRARVGRPGVVARLLLLSVVLGVAGALAQPARAAATTRVVTACTDSALRAAIAAANTANAGDVVTFSLTGACTFDLTQDSLGQISLTGNLTIDGTGGQITLSGGSAVQVFQVASTATATLKGLTISNGAAAGNNGGGIYNAGGTLTVSNSTLSGNSATFGGGINNAGTLTVSNSTLGGNSAPSGGGILNFGSLTVSNSTLGGNSATHGGGILNFGSLTVCNITHIGNSDEYGGGINNFGTLTVSNSTLSGNSARSYGGGIVNTHGTLTVSNSTLSGNSALSGGSIYNRSTLTVHSSILANNSCAGGVTDGGYNLEYQGGGALTCGFTLHARSGNPQLQALAPNGGPTQTMALAATSPALGAGSCADPTYPLVTTDQRGVARPLPCAIGAFEPAAPAPQQAPQTISFDPIPAHSFGDPPVTPVAGSSSGLPVVFAASGKCTAGGASGGTITITGAGSCTVTALQAGNAGYRAAVPVERTFAIGPATPQVSWPSPADISYGTPLGAAQLAATAAVPGSFAYAPLAGAVLPAGASQPLTVTFTPVDATNYLPVTATTTITVTQAAQAIAFGPLPDRTFGDPAFTVLLPPGPSGNPVRYRAAGPCLARG